MIRITLTAIVLAAVTGVVLPFQNTHAQTERSASDRSASLFEEITVTARRREETLYETPAAVTAMNTDAIAALNIDNLDDVGKYVPNLTITRYGVGNTSQAAVFIRGIARVARCWSARGSTPSACPGRRRRGTRRRRGRSR